VTSHTQEDDARELVGIVEAVRHHNPDDGWTVARVRVSEGSGEGSLVSVVGNLAEAREGMEVKLWGEWVTHPQWGEQFRFRRYELRQPMTVEQIKRFLASGAVRGIGPATAELLVARFGDDTLNAMTDPDQLRQVPGIGKRRAQAIAERWRRQRLDDKQRTLMRLQGMGITAAQAIRIEKQYGGDALAVVQDNPYQLALEVEGIGFKIADRIARTVGMSRNSPARLQAGLGHALQQAAQQGHCFLPKPRLLEYAGQLLECDDPEMLADACDAAVDQGWMVVERMEPGEGARAAEVVYLPRLWRAEHETARHIRRLLDAPAGRPAGGGDVPEPAAGGGGARGPRQQGVGAHRRAGRGEDHGHQGPGGGVRGVGLPRAAGQPHRPRRAAAVRAHRPAGEDHPPAAGD